MTNRLDKFSFGNPPGALSYVAGNRDGSTADLARQPISLMLRKSRRSSVNQFTKIDSSLPSDEILIAAHNILYLCYYYVNVQPSHHRQSNFSAYPDNGNSLRSP
jgi:hypothetical protein